MLEGVYTYVVDMVLKRKSTISIVSGNISTTSFMLYLYKGKAPFPDGIKELETAISTAEAYSMWIGAPLF